MEKQVQYNEKYFCFLKAKNVFRNIIYTQPGKGLFIFQNLLIWFIS